MLELARIALGLVLVLFLPGIALVYALFPRKGDLDLTYDGLYRVFLGVGFSVVTTILVGFGLNMLGTKDDGTGYFTTLNIVAALLALTAILLIVAFFRGAFPFLGRIHPVLFRDAGPGRYQMAVNPPLSDGSEAREIERLAKRRSTLTRRLARMDRSPETPELREEKGALARELETINSDLERQEGKRSGMQ